MRTAAQQNSGGQNVRAKNDYGGFIDQRRAVSTSSSLIAMRSDRARKQLVQAGLETYSDAQKKIQGFYNETNGLIQNRSTKY
jgi:hypothetical protein